jgi:hypothetical protein
LVKVVQIPILFECQCPLLPFEAVESIFRTASPLQHFYRFYDVSNKRGIVVLATRCRMIVSQILCPVLLITATGSCFGEFNNREWLMLLIVHGFTRSLINSRDKLQH